MQTPQERFDYALGELNDAAPAVRELASDAEMERICADLERAASEALLCVYRRSVRTPSWPPMGMQHA